MSTLLPSSAIATASGMAAFTDLSAVQAWDAWFRWREGDRLRDTSIDATWRRVADALASVESAGVPECADRFHNSFSAWHMLPDERLIAQAGTGTNDWPGHLSAAINLAAMVCNPMSAKARFDGDLFYKTAQLCTRMLDNAAELPGVALREPIHLAIGVIGMADALALLDIPYASLTALGFARQIGDALRHSTLETSRRLEAERGGSGNGGRRHGELTALASQRRLALLANNVSDAIAPLPNPTLTVRIDAHARPVATRGYAMEFAHRVGAPKQVAEMSERSRASPASVVAMRDSLAPYFDRVSI